MFSPFLFSRFDVLVVPNVQRTQDLDSARELKRGGLGEKKEPSKRGGRSNIVAGSPSKQTQEPRKRQQENFGLGSEYSRESSPGDNGSSVVQVLHYTS
jgi:hypothetical protein